MLETVTVTDTVVVSLTLTYIYLLPCMYIVHSLITLCSWGSPTEFVVVK